MQKIVEDPLSIKRVDPVEDHWIVNNSCRIKSFSIHVSASKLGQLLSRLGIQGPFESICVVIWQSISRMRDGPGPQVVTICKKGEEKKEGLIGNTRVIGVVKEEHGVSDVVVYGANLTFVNVEGADLYGFDWRGHKPRNVSYLIDGVGDAGTVLVLSAGPNEAEGKLVTMTFPEDEIMKLKNELNNKWSIA
ncbi:putative disease resistance protein RPP13-like [Capsicum annuum]|nr:putative disease resistance protein RPP13-like [Capsicum annuum]